MIENLTSEQLAIIQHGGHAISGAILIVALIYLTIGIVTPERLGHQKRWPIVGRTVGMIGLAFVLAVGVIFFTHSHPNGPHAFKGYMQDYVKHECLAGKDLPACQDLKDQSPPTSERNVRGAD